MNKILVVDDDRTVIKLTKGLLTKWGYTYDFMPNANYLFERLDYEIVDLILLDINLPDIDGITLLQKIKAHAKYKTIPVIMLTGETDRHTLAKCFECGADDYITKPVNKYILQARVKNSIHKLSFLQASHGNVPSSTDEGQNNTLQKALHYTKKLRERTLPNIKWIQSLLPELFVFFQPKDKVSGDFYWCIQREDTIIIIVADCISTDINDSLLSLLVYSILNKITREHALSSPDAILAHLSQKIDAFLPDDASKDKEKLSLGICCIDVQEHTLSYAGIRCPLAFIQNETFSIIEGEEWKGSDSQENETECFQVHTLDFNQSTMVYLYTDGFEKQLAAQRKQTFSYEKFTELLMATHKLPPKIQKKTFKQSLAEWMGDEVQTDDVLIVGFRVGEAP